MNPRAAFLSLALAAVLFTACSKSAQTTSQTSNETSAVAGASSNAPEALGSPANQTPTPQPTTPAMLTPPAAWNAVSPPPLGAVGSWVEPGNAAALQSISLVGMAYAGSLEDWVLSRTKFEQTGVSDLTEESSQDIFICNGHPARIIRWSATQRGQLYQYVQVYAIEDTSGPTGYVATYVRTAGSLELPEAVTALQTLCAK
jgi:hypothetical protein